ncbi:hypothetical protein J6590_012629 [Homalodisca vitripennis]|nr:hypothetical protein J6590_012629 [Homalodisca vitripennis]
MATGAGGLQGGGRLTLARARLRVTAKVKPGGQEAKTVCAPSRPEIRLFVIQHLAVTLKTDPIWSGAASRGRLGLPYRPLRTAVRSCQAMPTVPAAADSGEVLMLGRVFSPSCNGGEKLEILENIPQTTRYVEKSHRIPFMVMSMLNCQGQTQSKPTHLLELSN